MSLVPPIQLNRRTLLNQIRAAVAVTWGAGLSGLAGAQAVRAENASAMADLAQVWRRQGGVLLIRHAATEAGLGDPPGFVLGQCRTQRNLNEAGRQAAVTLGQWMRVNQPQPDAVLSSPWCRCQDTARLAFGRFENWPALGSTFAGQGDAATQEKALRERLQAMPGGRMEVWVTHQVIMTALTGAYPALGEGFVVDRQGRLLARAGLAA
jgi:phosphohistidine phosphatase SixA